VTEAAKNLKGLASNWIVVRIWLHFFNEAVSSRMALFFFAVVEPLENSQVRAISTFF
jgi:hypothetical protein